MKKFFSTIIMILAVIVMVSQQIAWINIGYYSTDTFFRIIIGFVFCMMVLASAKALTFLIEKL